MPTIQSRCGLPENNTYYDIGKSLVGASRELADCYSFLGSTGFQQAASHLFAAKCINCHFSPALSSTFRGGSGKL